MAQADGPRDHCAHWSGEREALTARGAAPSRQFIGPRLKPCFQLIARNLVEGAPVIKFLRDVFTTLARARQMVDSS